MRILAILLILCWLIGLTSFSAAETDTAYFDKTFQGPIVLDMGTRYSLTTEIAGLPEKTIRIQVRILNKEKTKDNLSHIISIKRDRNPENHFMELVAVDDNKPSGECDFLNEDETQTINCNLTAKWKQGFFGEAKYMYEMDIQLYFEVDFDTAINAPDSEQWDIDVTIPAHEYPKNSGIIIGEKTYEFNITNYPVKPNVGFLDPVTLEQVTQITDDYYENIDESVKIFTELFGVRSYSFSPSVKKINIYFKAADESEWEFLGNPSHKKLGETELPGMGTINKYGYEFELNPEEVEWENGDYDLKFIGCAGPNTSDLLCGDETLLKINVNVPEDILTIDETPPELTNKYPKDGSVINDRKPLIAITANDPESGIDVASIEIKLDGEIVKANFDYDSNIVSHIPANNLDFRKHNVEITVFNKSEMPGSSTEKWDFEISEEPVPYIPPTADLSVASNRGEGPFDVDFSYFCGQGSALLSSCRLNFGDGNYTQLIGNDKTQVSGNIIYTYPTKEGSYNAILTAEDPSGYSANDTIKIYSLPPANKAPVINAILAIPQFSDPSTGDAVTINEGEGIQLTADANDPDGNELTYTWDFGDGEIDRSNSKKVYYSYYFTEGETTKKYRVTLTVSDGELEVSEIIDIIVEKALMKIKVIASAPGDEKIVKGNTINVRVEISNIFDELITAKDINAYFNDPANTFALTFDRAGIYYSGDFVATMQTPNTGYIFIVANTTIGIEKETAGTVFKVDFPSVDLREEVFTTPSIPAVGSTLENISVRLDYPDNTPVNNATVIGRIEGSDLGNILFSETASGVYEADLHYEVLPKDSGGLTLLMKATDEYGNGSEDFNEHRIETNPLNPLLNSLAGIIAILFVAGIGSFLLWQRFRDRKIIHSRLSTEKTSLQKELKKLKYQYHKRKISEAKYKDKVLRIEQNLAIVNELLGAEKTTDGKIDVSEKEKRKEKMILDMRNEIENIDKLVKKLRGREKKFSRKEIKEAILEEGYSLKIAEKVADILYKDKKN